MRRLIFYLAVSLLAFGFGSVIAFNFYWKTYDKISVTEIAETVTANQTEKNVRADSALSNSSLFTQTNQVNDAEEKPKLSCSDKELLPVWNELKKDRHFREREKDFYMNADCSEMLEVQKIDLNDDGRKEIVLWGNNGNLCGGTGNCDMWIYKQRNGKYNQLLQSNALNDGAEKWFEVKQVKSNGYRNILLKSHDSASETIEYYYEYNGNRYTDKQCLYVSYISPEKEPSIMTCKEARKR